MGEASVGIPLPALENWPRRVKSALLHVITLAQHALVYTRSWAANSCNQRVRQAARLDQLEQEIALLREEIRIKAARLDRIPPGRRPHYQPTERLAILELRGARGWSLAQTAKVLQVTAATIASWTSRLDEDGPDALLRVPEPVNKFPDFVRHVVQRLQTLSPLLGKVKIAQTLARAGLHLATSTVGRMRRQKPGPSPMPPKELKPEGRRVTAKYPNHVWHTDLTVVPTAAGFWTSWLPFALPQCWPFCWWVAVVLDHHSRRALASTVFKKQPTAEQVRGFLGRAIAAVGAAPKYLVTDGGVQFTCAAFKPWCLRHGIRHRRGAVGKSGSIAVVERFILTLKSNCTRILPVVPMARQLFQHELQLFQTWYNSHRPHSTLDGAPPDEVYFGRKRACHLPRFEPRLHWPRGSPCARPQTLVKGQPGVQVSLSVKLLANRRHLPLVTITRLA
jgi:transposase InsO family protein